MWRLEEDMKRSLKECSVVGYGIGVQVTCIVVSTIFLKLLLDGMHQSSGLEMFGSVSSILLFVGLLFSSSCGLLGFTLVDLSIERV